MPSLYPVKISHSLAVSRSTDEYTVLSLTKCSISVKKAEEFTYLANAYEDCAALRECLWPRQYFKAKPLRDSLCSEINLYCVYLDVHLERRARGQARKGELSEGDESVAEAGRGGLLSAG
jgi:hypothetical protein